MQAEPSLKVFCCHGRVVFPRLPFCHHGALRQRDLSLPLGNHDLARHVPGECSLEIARRGCLQHEFSCGEVQGCQSYGVSRLECHEEVVTATVEPVLSKHGAGGKSLDHLPSDHSLGELGIFYLFANGHPVAEFNQSTQVLAGSLDRHPSQGDFACASIVAACESEAQVARGDLGVVLEHLVKVAHAEKQDRVLVLGFDLAILLHQRGF